MGATYGEGGGVVGLGNCPDTHTLLFYLLKLRDSLTIVELAALFPPSSVSTALLVHECVSVCVCYFNIPPCSSSHSKMGGDCSFTHTLLLRSRDRRGRGRSWGSTQTAGQHECVCGAFLTFYNLQHQTRPLVSMPIDLIDRKWTFKGFVSWFCSRSHASTLRSSWSSLLRAIKWQISPPTKPQILIKCLSGHQWKRRLKFNVRGSISTTIDYIPRRHYHAPKLFHFIFV